MNRKQEICRDFQRGNCRFGARCKYLHVTPQQLQQQRAQQSRNDFGGGGNYYDALNTNNNKQPQHQNQSSAKEHRCNDPRLCKDQIKEDFTNETPLFWRLTCYAHYKLLSCTQGCFVEDVRSLPNDIVGDVSPEELRAQAYEGAKQGVSLKDLAQREASMFNAKSAEFDALLRNPYNGPAAQNASAFPSNSFSSSPFLTPQKNVVASPFGQPAAFSSPATPQVFGQNPFGGAQTQNSFGGTQSQNPFGGTQTQNAFGGTQTSSFSFGQPRSDFQSTNQVGMLSGTDQNPFGQQTNAFQGSPFGRNPSPSPAQQSNPTVMQGSTIPLNMNGLQSPFMATPSVVSQANPPIASPTFPPPSLSAAQVVKPALFSTQAPVPHQPQSSQKPQDMSNTVPDISIWFKEAWKLGEIPEVEPPLEVRK